MNIQWPHPSLREAWDAGVYHTGSTEPWTVEIIASLIRAKQAKKVLEAGGYLGTTSAWLALTLVPIGGHLTVIEADPERCRALRSRLSGLALSNVSVWEEDALTGLNRLEPASIDVAYLDDDHTAAHVAQEIQCLLPKMALGGLILGHDVFGAFDLEPVFRSFGGISIKLPQIHKAGGLGIIQT
jgi:predicted O-methyltransferase YrrM